MQPKLGPHVPLILFEDMERTYFAALLRKVRDGFTPFLLSERLLASIDLIGCWEIQANEGTGGFRLLHHSPGNPEEYLLLREFGKEVNQNRALCQPSFGWILHAHIFPCTTASELLTFSSCSGTKGA